MKAIILEEVRVLGYDSLKSEQETAIRAFISGRDVFVCLPTGFGKSLCYLCLPRVYDSIHIREKPTSIIIVVSPLNALMKEQVNWLNSKGILAVSLANEDDESHDMSLLKARLSQGYYQAIFCSPEHILSNKEWKDVFQSKIVHENLVGFKVDEAHCIPKW